jgi:hypothetical protein
VCQYPLFCLSCMYSSRRQTTPNFVLLKTIDPTISWIGNRSKIIVMYTTKCESDEHLKYSSSSSIASANNHLPCRRNISSKHSGAVPTARGPTNDDPWRRKRSPVCRWETTRLAPIARASVSQSPHDDRPAQSHRETTTASPQHIATVRPTCLATTRPPPATPRHPSYQGSTTTGCRRGRKNIPRSGAQQPARTPVRTSTRRRPPRMAPTARTGVAPPRPAA